MKGDYLEKRLRPIGNLAPGSFSGIAELVREVFTRTRVSRDEADKISDWQLIFSQSKANGCAYRGEDLPHVKWRWPRDTWFQEHLSDHLKALECAMPPG
jgi:hypothetical protein